MSLRADFRERRSKLPAFLRATVLVILFLLLIYQLWLSYRDQVRTAEINTNNFVTIFEARLDATLRRTDADLKALSTEIPSRAMNPVAAPGYEKQINAILEGRLFNSEEMAGYRVHDALGDTLYSSDSVNTMRVNIADRPYFQLLRDTPQSGLVFSDVITGRSNGRQILVIARALSDEKGKFLGIVHGMIDLEHYRDQFRSLDLGERGVVALRRSDNHAHVVRWPESSEKANQKLAYDHPVVRRLSGGDKEVILHYSAPPENIQRIMSIHRFEKYPFYIAVGVGVDDVLTGWRKQAAVVIITSLLILGLVGTLLYRLGRMRIREAGILENLERSQLQFRELAHVVPVGICHFDPLGRYTYVNDRLMAITGQSREVLIGSDWSCGIHPEDRSRIQATLRKDMEGGTAFVREFRYIRPDGRVIHVLGEAQAVREPETSSVLGHIAALTDISERKQAEADLLLAKQQADSANLAKTRFLAAASHDLRQPIQAINLFRDALVRTGLNEEQKTISRFLSQSVQALGNLLYSLLDVSRLEAGLIRPRLKAIQVETLFKAMDAEFSSLARQKNLRFKLHYPFAPVILSTDPDLMLSILRNLVDNALKYTQRGGVLVGFRQCGGNACFQVWDTGAGIKSHHGDKIFEECYQVERSSRDRTRGMGLGLSIVQRTVQLLNGQVSYRSRFGKGSVFEVLFPFAQVQSEISVPMDRTERELTPEFSPGDLQWISGWRVIVIEDDPAVARSVEWSFRLAGIDVRVFASAETALNAPDVLGANFYISDFSLPGMNGIELLEVIQSRSDTEISALIVTGDMDTECAALSAKCRWKVLFKPVAFTTLLKAILEAANKGNELGQTEARPDAG